MTDYKNSAEIFNEFYEHYYKSILKYFKKDFGIDDAEDLTQQVFLQLWQWLPNSNAVKNKRALIYRIAKNVKLDRFRKNAVTLSTMPILEDFILEDRNNDFNIIDIQISITKLSPKEQHMLYMKLQGQSSAEIGKAFGLSSSAVRTRLQKIRKKLL